MIRSMLLRLETSPSALFYEKELVEQFPDEFEAAKRDKLIRLAPNGATYSLGLSRPRPLLDLGNGTFEAVDDEDTEADPIILTAEQVRRWWLDLAAYARRVQQANGLRGGPCLVDDRLYYLGEARRDGATTAYVLAFLNDGLVGKRYLKALPQLLSTVYDRYVVLCPSFRPAAAARRELEQDGIFLATMNEENPFVVDDEIAFRDRPRRAPRIVLTDEEEEEIRASGFRSRLPLHLTGITEPRKRNRIDIAGQPVPLTDAQFRLLLRLIVALVESADGFLERDHLRYGEGIDSEEALAPQGLDQALGRLRLALEPGLTGLKGTQLIEMVRKRVRLSTHRRFVTWNREALLRHPDQIIRGLARRLPGRG